MTNLPLTVTEASLRAHFTSILPLLKIEEVRIPRFTGTSKVKGFAYVQLAERNQVASALQSLNKTKLDGRTLTVEPCQSTKKVDQLGYTVHVSNLSFKVSEPEELQTLFEKEFGEVKRVHLVKEGERTKGYAFVEFVGKEAMDNAVRAKEVKIRDRLAIIKKSSRAITAKEEVGKKRGPR